MKLFEIILVVAIFVLAAIVIALALTALLTGNAAAVINGLW